MNCYGINAAGNYSVCTFTATVSVWPSTGTPGPLGFTDAGCQPATVYNDPGTCYATYYFTAPVATNNLGSFTATAMAIDQNGALIPLTLANGAYDGHFPVTTTGANIITFAADDGQGDTANRQCLVYVLDGQPPVISCQNQTATFKPVFNTASSTVSAQFDCNEIEKGETIWFSSVINTPSECNSPFTVHVFNQSISMVVNGQSPPIVIPVPDAYVTFNPDNTVTTTTFANGMWNTVAKPRVAGSTFLSGVAYAVTGTMVGCETGGRCTVNCCRNPHPPKIKKTQAVWTGTFDVDKVGIVVGWQWAAATYTQFSTDYTTLGVKAADSSAVTVYNDSYDAGTPENFKAYWVAGARGDNETCAINHYIGAETCHPKINLGKGTLCEGPVDFQAPLAVNNCDGLVKVTCNPPSGSVFGPGNYQIACTAADNSGNSSSCSFTLTVLAPLQVVFDKPACDNLNDNTSQPDAGFTDFNCPDDPSTPAVVNQFSVGCNILHQVRLLDCSGNDVTASVAPSVTVHMDVTERNRDLYRRHVGGDRARQLLQDRQRGRHHGSRLWDVTS